MRSRPSRPDQGPPRRHHDAAAAAAIVAGSVATIAHPPTSIRSAAAHARDWVAAYRDDGYAVVSADPFAAFLTQLTRSPMVESSSRRGVYALVAESPIRGLCESIRTVYAQAQAADDPEEKMGLLRDARRLMRLRAECEACGRTRGAEWPSDPVNAERPASEVSGA